MIKNDMIAPCGLDCAILQEALLTENPYLFR